MKEYFQFLFIIAVFGLTIANATSIRDISEEAFRFYLDGACNAVILMLVAYCFGVDKRL